MSLQSLCAFTQSYCVDNKKNNHIQPSPITAKTLPGAAGGWGPVCAEYLHVSSRGTHHQSALPAWWPRGGCQEAQDLPSLLCGWPCRAPRSVCSLERSRLTQVVLGARRGTEETMKCAAHKQSGRDFSTPSNLTERISLKSSAHCAPCTVQHTCLSVSDCGPHALAHLTGWAQALCACPSSLHRRAEEKRHAGVQGCCKADKVPM